MWRVDWQRLPDGVQAVTDWVRRMILLDPRLSTAEARSALAREMEHVNRGPVPDVPVFTDREEPWSSGPRRSLIGLDELADALVWAAVSRRKGAAVMSMPVSGTVRSTGRARSAGAKVRASMPGGELAGGVPGPHDATTRHTTVHTAHPSHVTEPCRGGHPHRDR